MSILFVFMITFTIFPAVLTDTDLYFLHRIDDPGQRFSWTMLAFIFAFNTFDTFGRWVAG